MTKLLDLAKDFGKNAKQQSAATTTAVTKEFETLQTDLRKELKSVETSLLNDINKLRRKHWTHAVLSVLPLTVLVMFATLATSAAWSWYVFGSKERHLVTIQTTEDGGKWAKCITTYHDPKDTKKEQPTYCQME